ncbi:DUF1330 domain-containing protein [Streptomyces sp. PTM05]|uniref:DUF1330 domain-containing protein n=1 Tax=Streptantibioticus parmotrematis TaxID=2873249 RepID=A0ABS7QK11_9ACTN|nr:DUF1330 domain-containing protein [Streptantibioticus parmotrematis]MBY8883526.1 DUF1330 domain-containing protein [Streptantibioticus parmotrematis]
MTAYAVAHVHTVEFGPDIVTYLKRIDATLEPFGGYFVVHGGDVEVVEGSWGKDLIIIAFPDRERLRAWYDSAAYREILPLRTDHMDADIVFAQGVPADYRAASALEH